MIENLNGGEIVNSEQKTFKPLVVLHCTIINPPCSLLRHSDLAELINCSWQWEDVVI
jgi:hypothetical protein